MALSIKDPKTEELARRLASRTGESLTVATRRALEERLKRIGASAEEASLRQDLAIIRRRIKALPVLDPRSTDEMLGYGADGLPD